MNLLIYRQSLPGFRAVLAVLGLLIPMIGRAQWASQTITLRPGWNAVFLEVQPEPQECTNQFANLPVESVWRYNRKQTVVQFIEDPAQLVPNAPDWLTWLPAGNPLGARSTLFTLEGGLPYLIKLADNSPTIIWTNRGRPVSRSQNWLENSVNFVGFCLPTNNLPTFQNFFTNVATLAPDKVFQLVTNFWKQVPNPTNTVMKRGEAFWIQSVGLPDYVGPLEVQLNRRVGIEFGRALVEETFRVRNPSTNLARTVVVRQLFSENPPSPAKPALAGVVPLSNWQDDVQNKHSGWADFPAQLVYSNVPPGGTVEIRLAVRRRDFAAYSGDPNALYQSLLEVTDLAGTTRTLIPVSAESMHNLGSGTALRGYALANGTGAGGDYAGLWIGTASITNVSRPGDSGPRTVAAPFPFRILVHVGTNGNAQFLQRAVQMWQPGTYKPAGDGTTNRVFDQPGRFELYSDESRIPTGGNLTGAALVNGQAVARRFSSAAFGFRDPILMGGTFGGGGSVLSCDVLMDYDDPLNPFRHAYHPDHDNLEDRTGSDGQPVPLKVYTNAATGLRYTTESYGVNRHIQLTFQDKDPENLALSGWGDKRIGGNYQETITGLHSSYISVSGTFSLQYASDDPTLNQ